MTVEILLFLSGLALSGVLLGIAAIWERTTQRNEQRKKMERSATELYVNMRQRKHETMRQMRDVAKNHRAE
ncbi:hypothetical protein ACPXCE_09265 [Streptomyces sp. DT24]|uniref:hypothetical protein n=1 Tax=unclassified Streptomyces TaxID=2593676 RepID=UPI0023B91393|nr:hypothetical protein [Streptomyces sp. AM 4-1-1]WEH33627.1 hypothetical protein PZB75_09720 [Streptomyces sp. AM 4-1-1]